MEAIVRVFFHIKKNVNNVPVSAEEGNNVVVCSCMLGKKPVF